MLNTINDRPGSLGRRDEHAITELFGYILLMAIIISGIGMIVMMTLPSVDTSKDSAQFNHIEQAFTTADSRISKARFSTSIYQETPFQLNEGQIIVDGSDSNSYIEIYKGSLATPPIVHATMGTIKCITDQGEIAYQDGGVWAKYPGGGSVMVSPPDFDYNGETLTLPIMTIAGNESLATSSGSRVMIDVKSRSPTKIYPGAPAGTNPVEKGKDIIVKVKSDYYQAWADFINERTKATATVDHANKIAIVTLKTGVPTQSGLLNSGMNTKKMLTDNNYGPLTQYTVSMEKRNAGKDYFLALHPPVGTDPFLNIETDRLNGPGKEEIAVIFKYDDVEGDIHEVFSTKLQFDNSTEFNSIDVDLLSKDILLTYGDANGDGDTDDNEDVTFDSASSTWGTDPAVYDVLGTYDGIADARDVGRGDTKTLRDVSQHYLRLMSTKHPLTGPVYYAFGTENGNNNEKVHYDPQASTFLLQYDSIEDLKYLYVTQGVIEANLSSSK